MSCVSTYIPCHRQNPLLRSSTMTCHGQFAANVGYVRALRETAGPGLQNRKNRRSATLAATRATRTFSCSEYMGDVLCDGWVTSALHMPVILYPFVVEQRRLPTIKHDGSSKCFFLAISFWVHFVFAAVACAGAPCAVAVYDRFEYSGTPFVVVMAQGRGSEATGAVFCL